MARYPSPLVRDRAPNVSAIIPNLLVGECPWPEDVAWRRTERGVGVVFSLQDDEGLAVTGVERPSGERASAVHGVCGQRVAIPDDDPSRLTLCLDVRLADLARAPAEGARMGIVAPA